jgi:Tfp pilus assembly major pilin PilA
VIWANKSGGSDVDYGEDVATDANGNVYLSGGFVSSSITFGSTTLNNSGSDDVFLTKYDAGGNVLWAKKGRGSGSDYAINISMDVSGNIYVLGNFLSGTITFGATTLSNSGANDIFLTKYDANGNVVWAQKAGGTSDDYSTGIATDASGNTYVTGISIRFDHFGSLALNNSGVMTSSLQSMTTLETVQWAKKIGGTSDDYGSYIPAMRQVM